MNYTIDNISERKTLIVSESGKEIILKEGEVLEGQDDHYFKGKISDFDDSGNTLNVIFKEAEFMADSEKQTKKNYKMNIKNIIHYMNKNKLWKSS